MPSDQEVCISLASLIILVSQAFAPCAVPGSGAWEPPSPQADGALQPPIHQKPQLKNYRAYLVPPHFAWLIIRAAPAINVNKRTGELTLKTHAPHSVPLVESICLFQLGVSPWCRRSACCWKQFNCFSRCSRKSHLCVHCGTTNGRTMKMAETSRIVQKNQEKNWNFLTEHMLPT